MSIRVDFIAGHILQARAGESVFEALKDRAECRWRIGRGIEPEGAEAVVLMDHTQRSQRIAEGDNWKHKFYLMHDLGDVMAYKQERKSLRKFSIIFVPDIIHDRRARLFVWPWTKVWVGGWPKYDVAPAALPPLPERPTILYAPTWAGRPEWRTLLPLLAALPVNVIIKNHTYATAPDEPVSDFYTVSRAEVAAMEEAGRACAHPMIVAPPESNICAFFPHVDAIISDQSSVAAEFLPWGLAIETGANDKGEPTPGISRWYPAVQYRPLATLAASLKNGGEEILREIRVKRHQTGPALGAGERIADMIWEEICSA